MSKIQSFLRVAVTLGIVAIAAVGAHALWQSYMYTPWTRDGRVRADIVNVAPDVAGLVTEVRVRDNQRVRKGDVLFVVDPARYRDHLAQREAEIVRAREQLAQAKAEIARHQAERNMRSAQAQRRMALADDVITAESRADASAHANQAQAGLDAAQASFRVAEANLKAAQAARDIVARDLERSVVVSPVNGYVTNLNLHAGDFATQGTARMAVIDEQSFWIYGYFEETKLPKIKVGDRAEVRLMAGQVPLRGHVESIASGIVDRDNQTGDRLLANVNPVFTWVRLAQRVPVRIALDEIPEGLHLAAGMTATVTLTPQSQ
jgi:multidrug resistance efflux pump